ncbi:MAG: SRPBCC family protein [Acidimicrobiia bacterium]
MKITQEFEVQRGIDEVWDFFQDVPAVSQCLPGAELTEDRSNGTFAGKVSVKMGPMTASFEGDAKVSPDEASRSVHMEGQGVDRRGGSRGQMTADYRLVATDGGATGVTVDADITLYGAAAQFGRTGLIREMSSLLIQEFIDCLEAKLGAGTEAEADAIAAGQVRGFSLFFSSLAAALARFFKRLFGTQ